MRGLDPVPIVVRMNPQGLRALLATPDGPVGTFLARTALRVANRAKQLAPVDTGRLRSSIRWSILVDRAGLLALVGSDAEYALYAHEGRRPGVGPPPSVMQPWARRHGFDSPGGGFLVSRAIATRGTRGKPFLRDALRQELGGN